MGKLTKRLPRFRGIVLPTTRSLVGEGAERKPSPPVLSALDEDIP